ncbi:MAG: hypothetical protein RI947_660 [Candidatus Parcubacteria bacterium]
MGIAFLLRLIALNQSLWLDEATTAKVVMHYSPIDIVRQFSPNDFHPPLYYLFMKLWTSVWGYSEIALRMPSVIFALLVGIVVYNIGSLMKKGAGIWAAVFFLFNPLIMYYSQEARMYTLIVFLLSFALLFFLKAIDEGKKSDIVLFNISVGLSVLTFYGSVFFIAAFYIYLLCTKKFTILLRLLPGSVIGFAIISPLLYTQLMHSQEALAIVKNWSLVLGTITLKNLFLIPLKFSIGRIQYYPKSLYYFTAGLWTCVITYFAIRGGLRNRRMGYFFVTPLILGIVFSLFTPLLQYFRFLFLLVPLTLILAVATEHRWQRILIAAGYVVCSLVYLFLPLYHREDWKGLSSRLTKEVYIIESSADPIRYYRPDVTIYDLRGIEKATSGKKQLSVVPYTAEIYGFDYASLLEKKGFSVSDRKDYRSVIYERWTRKSGR